MIKIPFKIDFDPQADSMYVKIKDWEYSISREKDNLVFDYDKDNNLLWIEILNVSDNEKIIKDLIYSWKINNEVYIN